MGSRQSFCLALKAARERRGVTLAQIAQATKVCVSHFAALERNDLRSWPKGLFRRAFFRGYVEMIGLPVAETMDEFARLFPDNEAAALIAQPGADASALRLSFDSSWHGPRVPLAWRIVTALIDGGAVLVVAAAFTWLAGTHAGTTLAVISVSYFTIATVLLGDSATAALIRRLRARMAAWRESAPDESAGVVARAWRCSVSIAANVFGGRGEATPAESVESREQAWTTDARRIRAREGPPRLRVRFKVP
jgi:transcriptional regulator with XRE-family HTH domain